MTGTHAPSLTRLLRAATGLGLAHEVEPGRFRLTETGALLRTDIPDSMNAIAGVSCSESMMGGWLELPETVRTGRGRDFFSVMAQQPQLAAAFHEAMVQGRRSAPPRSPRATISRDSAPSWMSAAGPERSSKPSWRARRRLAVSWSTWLPLVGSTASRPWRVISSSPSQRAATCTCSSVIHDWDDERARVILRNCRTAMSHDARLLLVERLLPERAHDDALMFLSDVNMLVNLGGRERAEQEFRALLDACSLRLDSVVPVRDPAGFHLIEAVPV